MLVPPAIAVLYPPIRGDPLAVLVYLIAIGRGRVFEHGATCAQIVIANPAIRNHVARAVKIVIAAINLFPSTRWIRAVCMLVPPATPIMYPRTLCARVVSSQYASKASYKQQNKDARAKRMSVSFHDYLLSITVSSVAVPMLRSASILYCRGLQYC